VRLPITEEDSDDDEAAPRPPLLPPSKTATEEKDLGNELFRRGDTAGALAAYSRSLVLEPGSAAVYSNRAAVHLKVRSAPIPSVRMEAGK
jgi:Flp pilus assembly protein TadD